MVRLWDMARDILQNITVQQHRMTGGEQGRRWRFHPGSELSQRAGRHARSVVREEACCRWIRVNGRGCSEVACRAGVGPGTVSSTAATRRAERHKGRSQSFSEFCGQRWAAEGTERACGDMGKGGCDALGLTDQAG